MGGRVGTLSWMDATGGRLRQSDRLRLLGQALLMQARELPLGLLARLGVRPWRLARFDLDELRIPDSPACVEAAEICAAQQPHMLVNHCYRTYAWAVILGRHRRLAPDEEVLFVSALLHDLGLTDRHRAIRHPTCFTLIGATEAARVAEFHDWSASRRDTAAEAITLHMNLRVPPSQGVEAHLMMGGTQLDVIGAGSWQVAPETVDDVLTRYPRVGVKRGIVATFAEHSRTHPGSRARFYQRYLGLPLLVRAAPFKE
jgi:hypothetical protein